MEKGERMKEYICKEVQTDNGGYLEIETELIRCEDCKHRYTECGMEFCEKLDSMFYYYEDQEPLDADFYCKWAEPKETK